MKNILIKNALIYFIINLSNIALGQNNIEGVCSFVPVPMAGWYSYQVGGEPRIIGDADKSKSDWIKNIKNPKVMQLKIDGTNFEFAVGFDKFGNKWIVPYNFDKFQPYKDVPFVFNEICTEETIYLRLPRYKELQAFTLRRYFQEEKDKNEIGRAHV